MVVRDDKNNNMQEFQRYPFLDIHISQLGKMAALPTWGKELYKTLQTLMFSYVLGWGRKKGKPTNQRKTPQKSPQYHHKNDTRNLQTKRKKKPKPNN